MIFCLVRCHLNMIPAEHKSNVRPNIEKNMYNIVDVYLSRGFETNFDLHSSNILLESQKFLEFEHLELDENPNSLLAS